MVTMVNSGHRGNVPAFAVSCTLSLLTECSYAETVGVGGINHTMARLTMRT